MPADPPQLCDTTTFCCNNIRAFTTTARPLRREIHSATIILHVWPSQWCSNFSHRFHHVITDPLFLFVTHVSSSNLFLFSNRETEREREIYLRASLRVIINVCLTVIALYKVNCRCSLIYSNDNINKLIRGMAVAK